MTVVEKIRSKVKGVYDKGHNFVKEHKSETIGISLAVIAVASLTAAYFLSPAYATFVGTVGTKAATLVSPAITAVSAFLVAHPLVASFIVVAAVAALIAAPVYAYMNSSKAGQIGGVKELLKTENVTTKLNVENQKTVLDKIAVAVGWAQKV